MQRLFRNALAGQKLCLLSRPTAKPFPPRIILLSTWFWSWTLRQNLESSGHQEKYKSHTSVGRKFAPVEGLSHDLVCTGSIYHVHFAWQVWHGQLSPRFKFNKLKSFSGVEIDQNHVDNKMILGGKGFAAGRLKRHNFCPASVCLLILSRCWCNSFLISNDLFFKHVHMWMKTTWF